MLVQEKLAICINSWEGVDSVYWWRDKIEEASEAVLLVKCEDGMGAHVSARIKELHSYESPSIIEL
jgi:periplasmic divalent cation tolerance protein